jgi:hypothetical protein
MNTTVWVLWGSQCTVELDYDTDIEALIVRTGRTNWSIWYDHVGHNGMSFISSELVNGIGIQYTIKKRSE